MCLLGNFTVLGKLGAPHGVNGWLKVHSFTEDPKSIFNYDNWSLGQLQFSYSKKTPSTKALSTSLKPVNVELWKVHSQKLIVKLKGVEQPEEAGIRVNDTQASRSDQCDSELRRHPQGWEHLGDD